MTTVNVHVQNEKKNLPKYRTVSFFTTAIHIVPTALEKIPIKVMLMSVKCGFNIMGEAAAPIAATAIATAANTPNFSESH
jgi:hypothetical protein